MQTCIFVDGAHLNSILRKHHGGGTIAYEKLAAELSTGHELLRTYYYDSPPFQSNPPTPDESRRFAARAAFFASLRKLSKYEVREGRCQRVWDRGQNTWKYNQKRVDVWFSIDLVRLASKGKLGRAVIVTGDSDFLPAVTVARDEGVSIVLVHSPDLRDVHRDLYDNVDERLPFDAALFNKVKR